MFSAAVSALAEAKSVTATFTLLQYGVTVATDGTGSGQAAVSPESLLYDYGTVITLTATADTGSSFTDWSGDGSGSTNPITITIDGAKAADEAFTTSASAFVMPVVEIDGVTLGSGTPGPIAKRLREIYIEESRATAI